MAKRLTKEEIEKLDKSIDEELQRNPEMRRELEEMREGAAMHCAGELMDAKQFRLILKACDEDADMMKRVLDYFPKPLDIGTAILVMERFGMLIPQATTEDGTPIAAGWDDWDDFSAEEIDFIFGMQVARMPMDSKTLKILLLEAFGFTPRRIKSFLYGKAERVRHSVQTKMQAVEAGE